MDLSDSQVERAFRDEVRAWLAANLPADVRGIAIEFAPDVRVAAPVATPADPR